MQPCYRDWGWMVDGTGWTVARGLEVPMRHAWMWMILFLSAKIKFRTMAGTGRSPVASKITHARDP